MSENDKRDSELQENFEQEVIEQHPENEEANLEPDDELALDEHLENDLEPDNDSSVHTAKGAPKKSSFKGIFIFLLLAILGFAGYWGWKQWQKVEAAEAKSSAIDEMQSQLESQKQRIQKLSDQQQQQATTSQSNKQELEQQVEGLQQQLIVAQRKFQSVSTDSEQQKKQWQLAEAEYLIRQAAQKVHYSDDVTSIVALLQAADQQVTLLADSNLLPLRRAIASDINQIRAIGSIDSDGILVKLDAIQELLPSLTLSSVKLDSLQTSTATTAKDDTDSGAWGSFKKNMKDTFSDYYKIHHYDQAVKPFINPQQSELLQQNILLNLKTAQLATLRRQQTIYTNALLETKEWIEEFYKKDSRSKTVINELQQLASASISLELPKQMASLQYIKQHNKKALENWLTPANPAIQNANKTNAADKEQKQQGKETEEAIIITGGVAGDIDTTIEKSLEKLDKDKKKEDEKTNESIEQGDPQ